MVGVFFVVIIVVNFDGVGLVGDEVDAGEGDSVVLGGT